MGRARWKTRACQRRGEFSIKLSVSFIGGRYIYLNGQMRAYAPYTRGGGGGGGGGGCM